MSRELILRDEDSSGLQRPDIGCLGITRGFAAPSMARSTMAGPRIIHEPNPWQDSAVKAARVTISTTSFLAGMPR